MPLFDDLIGNTQAKRCLERLISIKRSHFPLLFAGPEGIGKSLFALRFASHFLDERTLKGEHPDLRVFRPEGKGQLHPFQSIQEMIKEAHLSPYTAEVKFFIFLDAERMLAASSNALLKILEEPPSSARIILTTSQPQMLLATLASRLFRIDFFPPESEEFTSFIQTRHTLEKESASELAELSRGSFSALQLLLSEEMRIKRTLLKELLCAGDYLTQMEKIKELEALLDATRENSEELWRKEIDLLFEELFRFARCEDPKRLKRAVYFIEKCKKALEHHVKIAVILEAFCLMNYTQTT